MHAKRLVTIVLAVLLHSPAVVWAQRVATYPPVTVSFFYRDQLVTQVTSRPDNMPTYVPHLNGVERRHPDGLRISGGPGKVYIFDNNSAQTNENFVGINYQGGTPFWVDLREPWVQSPPKQGINIPGAISNIAKPWNLIPHGGITNGDYSGSRDSVTFEYHRRAKCDPFGLGPRDFRTDNPSSVKIYPLGGVQTVTAAVR
jgi:hypothetical protein